MDRKELKNVVCRAKEGFTLIEIMVVVGIIGLLMAVLIPNVVSKLAEARIASARVQIKNVEEALLAYSMKHGGKYPDNLEVLTEETEEEDALLQGGIDDPWGTPIQFEKRGKKRPKITSAGPDTEFGTDDDLTNIDTKKK
jgi:general secretion pathway protein G